LPALVTQWIIDVMATIGTPANGFTVADEINDGVSHGWCLVFLTVSYCNALVHDVVGHGHGNG